MRNDQVVEFIDWRATTEMVATPDVFRFKPKGRLAFLQRLAWKFLHRTHAMESYSKPVTTVTRHRIDAAGFMERLYKQKASIFRFFGKEPRRLLIGAETYQELMCSPEVMQAFSFRAGYMGDGRNGRYQVIGLDVEVIPWMTGMVVMP